MFERGSKDAVLTFKSPFLPRDRHFHVHGAGHAHVRSGSARGKQEFHLDVAKVHERAAAQVLSGTPAPPGA